MESQNLSTSSQDNDVEPYSAADLLDPPPSTDAASAPQHEEGPPTDRNMASTFNTVASSSGFVEYFGDNVGGTYDTNPVEPKKVKLNSMDDVKKIVSKSTAPSVVLVYQTENSESERPDYSIIPLALLHECSDGVLSLESVELDEVLENTSEEEQELHGPSSGGPKPTALTKIPVEVFGHITRYLSSCDVKNMRLVSKAFERGVSSHLFGTVLVPFDAEFFGILGTQEESDEQNSDTRDPVEAESVSSNQSPEPTRTLQKQNLDIFRGFGSHIRRFGISFDVTERDISLATLKDLYTVEYADWGRYLWPRPGYTRFRDRAGLESTADQTTSMRAAFSHLNQVQHLALSITSGLGWISGPDLSIRSQILSQASQPFAAFKNVTEPGLEKKRRFWRALQRVYSELQNPSALAMTEFVRCESEKVDDILTSAPSQSAVPINQQVLTNAATNTFQEREQSGTVVDSMLRATLASSSLTRDPRVTSPFFQPTNPRCGILFTRSMSDGHDTSKPKIDVLNPQDLTMNQRQWLVETAWAQDAFLISYMISIADNPTAFQSVTTLTLSPYSSRHLTKLLREDFWDSLPALTTLELLVSPEWREIEICGGFYPAMDTIMPTVALNGVVKLLGTMIAPRRGIRNVTVGWTTGGEHAQGLIGRNNHLMPAPVTDRESCLLNSDFGLPVVRLPGVEVFKLVNCWIAPNILQDWVRRHISYKLRKLVLESVSMTAAFKDDSNLAPGWVPPAGFAPQMAAQVQQHLPQATPAQINHYFQQMVVNLGQGSVVAGSLGDEPREGSWPAVLGRMKSLASRSGKANLQVTLLSCGHALLRTPLVDESDIADAEFSPRASGEEVDQDLQCWMHQRAMALLKVLMHSEDELMGEITTAIPNRELAMLEDRWHLVRGWPSEQLVGGNYDDESGWGKWGDKIKEAAKYDGKPPGGTGRFSGQIVFKAGEAEDEDA